ncbi:MAG: hypothetical protein ACM31L_16890 [Actinomycetota bacterium]
MPRLQLFCAVLAAAVLLAPSAHAYVDPGSGTLLLQILGAAAVGGLFYLRTAWAKLRGLFSRSAGKSPQDDQAAK